MPFLGRQLQEPDRFGDVRGLQPKTPQGKSIDITACARFLLPSFGLLWINRAQPRSQATHSSHISSVCCPTAQRYGLSPVYVPLLPRQECQSGGIAVLRDYLGEVDREFSPAGRLIHSTGRFGEDIGGYPTPKTDGPLKPTSSQFRLLGLRQLAKLCHRVAIAVLRKATQMLK
ncbi:MAG: hypothetical protein M3137_17760 [Actinomycetota bacterium]|nr:hypothetical protein [Actinomycetota bacterium]